MNDTLLVALVVAVIGPVILVFANGYQRRKERKEDWRRQDEVAKRVAQVARAAKPIPGQLKSIHALVNSNMTAQMEANLSLMKEVMGLKESAGKNIDKASKTRIRNMEKALKDRYRQQSEMNGLK